MPCEIRFSVSASTYFLNPVRGDGCDVVNKKVGGKRIVKRGGGREGKHAEVE